MRRTSQCPMRPRLELESQAHSEQTFVLGTERPTLRNHVSNSDQLHRPAKQTILGQHVKNVVTHDPKRNPLVFPQVCDQSWSNHQQRPLTGQKQKAWVERRLKSFAGDTPLSEAAHGFKILGRKRLPARQNLIYSLSYPSWKVCQANRRHFPLSLTNTSYLTSSRSAREPPLFCEFVSDNRQFRSMRYI